LEYADI
jgi:hypothetical protein